ncbi:MAG: hypothetical protein KI785_09100 [Devosiaceae bacterium]|nr:hypothetical protein [Devosiaceae bacterium MH13]
MTFDTTTIAYYAAICGALAALAPRMRAPGMRVIVGALVGVAAATLFPALRSALGF